MRFRSYIALALTATAIVPFFAWSVLQRGDVDRRILENDAEQSRAAHEAARLVEERLETLAQLARYAARSVGEAVRAEPKRSTPVASEKLDLLLRDIVVSFPTLDNLHVDRVETDGARVAAFYPPTASDGRALLGTDHSTRWHVAAKRRGLGGSVAFSPVLKSSQNRKAPPILTFAADVPGSPDLLLSGAVELDALLREIESTLSSRGLLLTVLTPERQIVWPPSSATHVRTWPEVPDDRSLIGLGSARRFVTVAHLPDSVSGWIIVVSKPESLRSAERRRIERRTALLASAVLLLTLVAGWAAGRPLRRAFRQLEEDLDAQGFGTDRTTIRHGPDELRRVQRVYREVRRALDARNAELSATAEQRARELEAEELLFRSVFDGIALPFLLLDADWTPHLRNRAATSLTDRVAERLVDEARAHWTTPEAADSTTVDVRAEDGRLETFALHVFPFSARRSTLAAGYALLVESVTDREALKRMKDDLLGIVAHELKTPVTACRLQVERLESTLGPHEGLRALDRDLDHLRHIVHDWLSVARIDGGTFAVYPSVVQLDPILRKARRLVRARYDFGFSVSIDEEAECIFADASALTDVFVNLFMNACRYAKPDEKPVVEVTARREKNDIVIDVCDRGIGIAPEDLERIFDRFYQVSQGTRRRTGGTGLGLVICRAVCTAHGGTLEASCAGGVTRFTLRLPQPSP